MSLQSILAAISDQRKTPPQGAYISPTGVVKLAKLTVKNIHLICAISDLSAEDFQRLAKELPDIPSDKDGLSRLAWLKHVHRVFAMLSNIMANEIKKIEGSK